jgi:L-aminopeptidase/D-esterase-like protein
VHTPFDGDIVFALSTRRRAVATPRAELVALIGSVAADVLARAVARGVYEAESLGAWPSYRSLHRPVR